MRGTHDNKAEDSIAWASAGADIFGKKTIGGLVSWGIRLNYHENEDVVGEKLASSARTIVV